jgi:hypothetical protein
MGREQDYARLYTETLAIPPGATASFQTVPGFYGFAVEYISGGSLSVGGPSFTFGGSFTYMTGASGAAAASFAFGSSYTINNLFTLANSNVFMINDFVGRFNLIATGATSVLSLARVFTSTADLYSGIPG